MQSLWPEMISYSPIQTNYCIFNVYYDNINLDTVEFVKTNIVCVKVMRVRG